MKIRNLMATALVLAIASYGSMTASATVILSETFDYPDQAALASAWNASGNNSWYALDTAVGNPAPSYGMPSATTNFTGRLARNLPGGPVQATDANPLVMSFDFLLGPDGSLPWGGARHYIELRGYANGSFGSGALQNLIALGVNNNSSNTFNTTFYQGRVFGGAEWQTLNGEPGAPLRATDWQELKVTITGSEVQFSVAGTLAHVVARPNNFMFDSVVLGSDLTANGHHAWADNLQVAIIPEPSALMLSALGLVGVAGFRRRKA